MAITINGDGSITGLSVGGLPDGTVDDGTLASNAVTEAKIATDAVTAAKIPASLENTFVSGRKNLIINGSMAVAQRGTSTTSGAQVYLLDRFYTYSFAATGRTVSQSTDAPDEFSHSLKVQRASGNTATTDLYLSQPIESKNCVGTAGKKVTFSFWAKKGANWSKSSSTFPVTVTSGTGTDQSFMAGVTGGVTLINSSATLTTSWVKYSFTSSVVVPTNSTQLIYQTITGWTGTAGADDSFYITGIQLEVGETATDFEHRSYGEELALCQRYYEKSYAQGVAVGNASRAGSVGSGGTQGQTSTGEITGGTIQFSVEKRVQPTITFYDHAGTSGKGERLNAGITWFSGSTMAVTLSNAKHVVFVSTTGNAATGAFAHYTADAEL